MYYQFQKKKMNKSPNQEHRNKVRGFDSSNLGPELDFEGEHSKLWLHTRNFRQFQEKLQ